MIYCPKDCPDRSITCHSTCKQYLEKAEQAKAERLKRFKGDCVRDYCYELSGKKLKKMQKRKKQG